MSRLFKCLILSCLVSAAFGFLSVRDDTNWFKNRQKIKNGFVSGVVNGIIEPNCNSTENGTSVEGECLPKLECGKSGGKIGSICSLMGVCCVKEKTCFQSTSSKLSYFVPPSKFQTDCPLTINIANSKVCQIRLDFDRFDIAKPTNKKIESYYSSYQCYNDSFKVENSGKNLGFLHLCGKNKGQHIYIPVSEDQQRIVLRFNFKNRSSSPELPKPDWRIKIRQLECKQGSYDHLNVPTKLMNMYNSLKNKKNPKSDWYWIAPPNCLQYYPEMTGTFESFNYDNGLGCYIGHLNYAICLRKTTEICGAKYTAEGTFQMNYNPTDNLSEKCYPTGNEANSSISRDYIRIPGGKTLNNRFKDIYCDTDLGKTNEMDYSSVIVKSYEPLYVGVHTDGFRPFFIENNEDDDHEEIGFRMRYELFSGECEIPL